MFDALKARHANGKSEYSDYIRMHNRSRRTGGEGLYPTFDSLKLLGAENDAHYLDRFMAEGEKGRQRSASTSKGNKRHSANVDNIKKTLIGSLRSVASDENMYETVEVINYRKTIEAISRHNKVRSVPKTGHPLFDHLRVENVLKPRQHRHRHSDASNSPSSGGNSPTYSGGNSPSSSGGSGDEFDFVKKANTRFSRQEILKGSGVAKDSKAKHPRHDPRHPIEEGSESDDDWAIPRPKLMGGCRARRTGAELVTSHPHDESDSSSKSTGLR